MRVIKPPPLSALRVLEGEEPRDSLRAIRSMVSEDDLSVVFQPIVDLATGRLFASEALVRCRIAQFQPPPKLFEHAQQLGCVGRLGRLIREIAIPLCSGAPIFVNVHPGELDQGWLVRPDDPIFSHDADVRAHAGLAGRGNAPVCEKRHCYGLRRDRRIDARADQGVEAGKGRKPLEQRGFNRQEVDRP